MNVMVITGEFKSLEDLDMFSDIESGATNVEKLYHTISTTVRKEMDTKYSGLSMLFSHHNVQRALALNLHLWESPVMLQYQRRKFYVTFECNLGAGYFHMVINLLKAIEVNINIQFDWVSLANECCSILDMLEFNEDEIEISNEDAFKELNDISLLQDYLICMQYHMATVIQTNTDNDFLPTLHVPTHIPQPLKYAEMPNIDNILCATPFGYIGEVEIEKIVNDYERNIPNTEYFVWNNEEWSAEEMIRTALGSMWMVIPWRTPHNSEIPFMKSTLMFLKEAEKINADLDYPYQHWLQLAEIVQEEGDLLFPPIKKVEYDGSAIGYRRGKVLLEIDEMWNFHTDGEYYSALSTDGLMIHYSDDKTCLIQESKYNIPKDEDVNILNLLSLSRGGVFGKCNNSNGEYETVIKNNFGYIYNIITGENLTIIYATVVGAHPTAAQASILKMTITAPNSADSNANNTKNSTDWGIAQIAGLHYIAPEEFAHIDYSDYDLFNELTENPDCADYIDEDF